jgi:hypothetical protein
MSECRICFNSKDGDLVAPCHCKGSIRHIHQGCLVKWLKSKYPREFSSLLQSSAPKRTGIQCELCKYEFKANARFGNPLQILRKIRYSTLTYRVLMNIPIIIYLAYKSNFLLRHLFSFIYSHAIKAKQNNILSQKVLVAVRFYLQLCFRLFPVSLVMTILPMVVHSTVMLIKRLVLEFKVVQFEMFN